jgi:pre-rRNA-processing protein TSR3
MQSFPPTLVLRHRRENLKKCSLRGLETRSDFRFFTYPNAELPDLSNVILLTLDAPPITSADANYGLFILDSTWRYAEKMRQNTPGLEKAIKRSIPGHYKTAYPRRQDDCSDPEKGLASIEAIYIAYTILGRDTSGLLDHYYWKEAFLKKSQKSRAFEIPLCSL